MTGSSGDYQGRSLANSGLVELVTAKRCKGVTKGGQGCRSWALKSSAYCQAHDPGLEAKRAVWRSQGGKARATPEGDPVELLDAEDVRKGLAAAIGSTWELQNTAERSRALCQLYLAALKTFEVGELAERVAAFERRLGGQTDAERVARTA